MEIERNYRGIDRNILREREREEIHQVMSWFILQ